MSREKKEEKDNKAMEEYRLTVRIPEDTASMQPVSNMLYGIFLEDINFAVDGGMYGEMIKNRSFEYGCWAEGGAWHGWSSVGSIRRVVVDGGQDRSYLNENNTHYARLYNEGTVPAGIAGSGYLDGMWVKKDEGYRFSVFARARDGYRGRLTVRLTEEEADGPESAQEEQKPDAGRQSPAADKGETAGNVLLAQAETEELLPEWHKYELELYSRRSSCRSVRCQILIDQGTVDLDMVSLFPIDTFKGRENGIRREIGQALAELSPRFLRFPGGCITEGHTLANAYDWKDSVGNGLEFAVNGVSTTGDPAARKQAYNLWGVDKPDSKHPYYMTYGFGYYEYFLLCEDLGCLAIPIVNSGISCQFRGPSWGQAKDELPLDSPQMQRYVQDALDLVEFCRGDESTVWGNVRIRMGHSKPFGLKYIGIGNEQWGEVYFEHYEVFRKAFARAAEEKPDLYGGIELIVSNGPGSGNTEAWDKIREKGAGYAGLVDEHYYEKSEWFLANTGRYDDYDRTLPPVFVGEYAAKSNTLEAALAEAAYMTGLERNADVVALASYAPLFGNDTALQWEPDLLWFDGRGCRPSVNYFVQQMFAGQVGAFRAESRLELGTEEGWRAAGRHERQEVYQSVTMGEDGKLILKLVNVSAQPKKIFIDTKGRRILPEAEAVVLAGKNPEDANTAEHPKNLMPVQKSLQASEAFVYLLPGYSVSVIRLLT